MVIERPTPLSRDGRPRPGYATLDGAVEVDPDIAAIVRTEQTKAPFRQEPMEHIQRLREGAMLFVPNDGDVSWHARLGSWPHKHGMRVRQRRASHEGVLGHYVWLEEVNPGEYRKPAKSRRK